MKLKDAIQALGTEEAIKIAKEVAAHEKIDWDSGISFIFDVIINDPDRVPGNIGGSKDDERSAIHKWLKKYKGGYEGRASQRISNPPGTVADPIIDQIIGARLPHLTKEHLNKIAYAHRIGMSAENILGLLLEEYLSDNLKDSGWHCAWGETVRSVDFVNQNGRLLQIKNRSNSENSSSSAVRDGTQIEKWYRIKADKIEYMWDVLNNLCKTDHLSEENFVTFVKTTLSSNPGCLAIEDENPWSS